MAFEKSASSRMMLGDFPPSSRVTLFIVLTASFAIIFPTLVDPVKDILAISGFLLISAPTISPKPFTILNTPFGRFAS
ncbi:hypothetical protein D3C85_1754690 [compost metagenome]